MAYDNVSLWFAKDSNNEIATIDSVDDNERYNCPLCGSDVIPKKGKIKTWHFAHTDAEKCNGESMIHFWFKHKFLVKGDKFTVVADKEFEYTCKEVIVEKTYDADGVDYRPDVTIITECGEIIYFEMANTNKKKIEEYINSWIALGNIVVEVDLKSLVESNCRKFKALFYDGKCFNVKKGNTYYNTIGKYKEEILSGSDSKIKDRIVRLDWFWNEIEKYKNNETGVEDISLFISSTNDEQDRELIVDILKRNNCQNVIEDYLEYNHRRISKELKSIKKDYKYSAFRQHKIYDRLFRLAGKITHKNNSNIEIPISNIGIITKDELLKMIKIVEENIENEKRDSEIANTHFKEFSNYVNDNHNYNSICKNITLINEPNLRVNERNNYKTFGCNKIKKYKLYFEGFPSFDYRKYLKPEDCENKQHIYDLIKKGCSYNKLECFTKDDIIKIDQVAGRIHEKYNKYGVEVEISINNRYKISVKISHKNNFNEYVYFVKSDGFYSINLYNKLYLLIGLKINKIILREKKNNKINGIYNKIKKELCLDKFTLGSDHTTEHKELKDFITEYLDDNIHLEDQIKLNKIRDSYFIIANEHKEYTFKRRYNSLMYDAIVDLCSNYTHKEIKLFYRKNTPEGVKYKNLEKLNFVSVYEKLNKILDHVGIDQIFNEEELIQLESFVYDDELDSKRFKEIFFKNKDVEDFINLFLKTIAKFNGRINILLDIKHTNSNGYRPWLINDFIELLHRLGFTDVENI